jgi:hypothetical protein
MGRPSRKTMNLRRRTPRHSQAAQNRSQHIPHVIRGTNIAGAGRQRSHPHFFVRNTVRADDRQGRKVAVQTLDISQQPVLEVENHGFGIGSGYVVPQFLAGPGYVHRKMRAEATGQGPGHSRIAFEKNYALSHTSPSSTVVDGGSKRRKSTADVDNRLGLRGGLENHGSTDIYRFRIADRNPHIYRRAGDFSVSASNGSACSFPFLFSRISTFPSACSSSVRQADESCIPSSNSVREVSKGTSPFSSS